MPTVNKKQLNQLISAATEEFRKNLLKTLQPEVEAEVEAEVERRTQNGIKEPVTGGKCHKVWQLLDRKLAEGLELDLPTVRKLARKHRISENNMVQEFYRWKRFNDKSLH